MRKSITILSFLLLMSAALCAQPTMKGHSVDFTVGAGWSDLTYALKGGNTTGTWGGSVHVGYNWFFSKYFGLGAGLDWSRYGGGLTMTDREFVWQDVVDADGNTYDHHVTAERWRETQSAYYFEIPMSVQVAVPFEKVSFTAAWGVKYSVALADAHFRARGELLHTGDYGSNNIRMFYRDRDFRPEGFLNVNHHWSMFLNIGTMFPITRDFFFVTQVYTNTSIRPMLYCTQANDAGFRCYNSEHPYTFFFMDDYKSLLTTAATTGISSSDAGMEGTSGYTSGKSASSAYSFQIGLQVGFRYVFPTKKRSCDCK